MFNRFSYGFIGHQRALLPKDPFPKGSFSQNTISQMTLFPKRPVLFDFIRFQMASYGYPCTPFASKYRTYSRGNKPTRPEQKPSRVPKQLYNRADPWQLYNRDHPSERVAAPTAPTPRSKFSKTIISTCWQKHYLVLCHLTRQHLSLRWPRICSDENLSQ